MILIGILIGITIGFICFFEPTTIQEDLNKSMIGLSKKDQKHVAKRFKLFKTENIVTNWHMENKE